MPKAIYIKGSDKYNILGFLRDYKYNSEDGICVVFKNGKIEECGSEYILLLF